MYAHRSRPRLRFALDCSILTLGFLVLPGVARTQVFVLALSGDCTEEVTAAFAGATPGGSVAVYRSPERGADAVPSGPCAGTILGLSNPQLKALEIADGKGGFSTTEILTGKACSQLYQTVDLATCARSNVARLVTGFPAPVPWTGVGVVYEPGDDGDTQRGVYWPDPRFTDNLDGTVTDNLTGLVWLQYADCYSRKGWESALDLVADLGQGRCGLTDRSRAGDWRLPSLLEMQSLIDFSQEAPALPGGHPFIQEQSADYWTSTTRAGSPDRAWDMFVLTGDSQLRSKSDPAHVWPVRGGQ